jgi:uncharacterized protein
MTISMYQATIPVCLRALNNLAEVLKKGEQHAKNKKISHEVMLNLRLAADMLPLTKQIQIVSDTAKGAGARLAGVDNPKFEDTEKTFEELYVRIDKTIKFLDSIKPEQIDGSEEKEIVLKLGPEEAHFSGINYVLAFVLPNLMFHVTTAYNILRHYGVEIGKRDYLGTMPTL